jgi:hypothetical protein
LHQQQTWLLLQGFKHLAFWGRVDEDFAKFQPEKYDYELYKQFSMEKMTQIHQNSKKKFLQITRFL